MRRVVVRSPAMHRGAVVPDDEIPDAPGVTVDELRLGRVLDQLAEDEPTLGTGQSMILDACDAT
jgi:hypothetical protein